MEIDVREGSLAISVGLKQNYTSDESVKKKEEWEEIIITNKKGSSVIDESVEEVIERGWIKLYLYENTSALLKKYQSEIWYAYNIQMLYIGSLFDKLSITFTSMDHSKGCFCRLTHSPAFSIPPAMARALELISMSHLRSMLRCKVWEISIKFRMVLYPNRVMRPQRFMFLTCFMTSLCFYPSRIRLMPIKKQSEEWKEILEG
ncbi:hypothetical protein BDB01DRAFT_839404 [Pilobolus umbonatus]|nr:hypothetical protein BDB01DRAFT_839404 [Pilobolus umbonatus]